MMNRGKNICAQLKGIRKLIADANDIDYQPAVCTHKGECSGTCPCCEAEMRYIESELVRRRQLGKSVVVAGLAAGMTLGTCAPSAAQCVTESNPSLPTDTAAYSMPLPPPPPATDYALEGIVGEPADNEMNDVVVCADSILVEKEVLIGEVVVVQNGGRLKNFFLRLKWAIHDWLFD